MTHRSPNRSNQSRSGRSRTRRYNDGVPSAGLSGLLELEQGEPDIPILGEIDRGAGGSAAPLDPPKRKAAPRRSPSPKSQQLKRKTATSTGRRAPTKYPPRRKSKGHDLKATAAPLLATVGILLLVPAIWSALLLIGVGVPGAEREDSRPMAAVMLLSWPIAICLIAASTFFFIQVARQKKREAQESSRSRPAVIR